MCNTCKTAKAAVFMGPELPFDVREFPVTETPAGYGRCSLIASGVCGTDVHIHRGKLAAPANTVIGHEFVGRLEDCDPAEAQKYGLHVGDNVIADIAVPCGECPLCLAGDDANCVNMQVTNGGSVDVAPYLYGGYAQVNYTPLTNLVPIPAQLDPAMTATFACPGPTAIHAFALARRANIALDGLKVAVVQGLGPVGCFALLYLKALGVKKLYAVTAVKEPAREDLARRLGADEVLVLEEHGPQAVTELLQKENGGLGVDLCFEASGAPAAVPQGIEVLRNRGVYLIPGQYSNSGGVSIQPQLITFKALQILGSSQYSMADVKEYIAFLCAHPECHDAIRALGSRYPVEQVNEAFADAKAGKNIKTLLVNDMTEKKNAVLVLFAGQSNMQGQAEALLDDGVVENAFEYRLFGDEYVPLKDPVGENICYDGTQGAAFCEGDDPQAWLARHALGSACCGHSSMVPAFCRAFTAAAGCTVLAIHVAKGSTQAAEWLPGTGGYAVLLKKAKAALALAQRKYAVQSVSLVWLQGESDAIANVTKETYKAQLKELNAALQKELGLKRFGIIRVGSFTGTPRDAVIQTAQEELCAQQSGFVMLTRLTAELERDPQWMNPFVAGHFGAKGLAKLGAAAGKALAEQMQNKL